MAWSTTGTEISRGVRRYSQSVCSQLIPTGFVTATETVDGKNVKVTRALGFTRNDVSVDVVETTTEWRGMTEAAAKAKAAEIGSSVVMSGTGAGAYQSYSRTVDAKPSNAANGWSVVQVVKVATLA